MTSLKRLSMTSSRFLKNVRDLLLVAKYNSQRILLRSSTESTQVFIALASLVWAFLLFWPGESFSRPTYLIMSKFAGEAVWASLFLLQGLIGTWVVLLKSKSKILILADCMLGCVLWTGSCVAMLLSVYPPPVAISAEIVAALFSWWLLLRLPVDINK